MINIAAYHKFDLKLNYQNKQDTVASIKYERNFNNDYTLNSAILNWAEYFNNYANILPQNLFYFFYPPFSSVYKEKTIVIFSEPGLFTKSVDSLTLVINWQLYINENIFCPKTFKFNWSDIIFNKPIYRTEHNYIFELNGGGKIATYQIKSYTLEYSFLENLLFSDTKFTSSSTINIKNMVYFYENLNLISLLNYKLIYNALLMAEQEAEQEYIEHKIFVLFSIYKNFFKKDYRLNDKYGFEKGDEIIRETARIILEVVRNEAGNDSFVGHIGGDDFVFITDNYQMDNICKKILKLFDKIGPSFYNEADRKAGYIIGKDRQGNETKAGLLSISIGIVSNEGQNITHVAQISEIGAELKKYAKTFDKSNFVRNKRKA